MVDESPASGQQPTRAYEVEDFHPNTGHRHHCEDSTSCDCAAWLYALAVRAANPVPTGWWVTRRPPSDPVESAKQWLRWLLSGWLDGEDDVAYLRDALSTIERDDPHDWTCCPLCQEVVCDDGCPLYTVRDEAGLWVGSKGARGE